MRYFMSQHQHKGQPIQKALRSRGWVYARRADIVLFDVFRNNRLIQYYVTTGVKMVIYPHTAVACWWYDGIMELPKEIAAILVVGEGQAEVQRIITPDVPVYPIGWGYCEILPFQKPDKVKHILFCPIHPSGKNLLREEAKETNAKVFRELLKLKDVQIVVRIIGTLEANGLWQNSKVIWVNAKPDGSTSDIDIADVVIAEGMALHLAVARGKPAIGMNQNIPNRINNNPKTPENWEKYNHLQAYPVDFSGDIIADIDRAISNPPEVKDWKERHIGTPLDPRQLTDILERIYAQQKE